VGIFVGMSGLGLSPVGGGASPLTVGSASHCNGITSPGVCVGVGGGEHEEKEAQRGTDVLRS
jgi:hypothetical protein